MGSCGHQQAAAPPASPPDHPRVAVGGVEIPPATIAAEVQNHPAPSAEAAWEAAARALVLRQLLLDEAARLGLTGAGLADAEGRRLAAEDAAIEALLEAAVTTPKADEATARLYYQRHKDRFSSPTLVEAEHILFAADPQDDLAYGLAAGDARQAIRVLQREPGRFGEYARAHSACPSKEQGGNLGQIGPGQTVKPFEDVLFALAEGALHPEPVKSRFGVHVIRAGRRVEGQQLPFELVEDKIAQYLEEASFRRAVSQYLTILASRTTIEGVDIATSDSPLVQ
ncbi:MAG: peptidylprolyl isomerase [Sphingomonadaceae bacterium]|nr:peptidylprolyl isomerase [Sphingomonadaceae bacterium]